MHLSRLLAAFSRFLPLPLLELLPGLPSVTVLMMCNLKLFLQVGFGLCFMTLSEKLNEVVFSPLLIPTHIIIK